MDKKSASKSLIAKYNFPKNMTARSCIAEKIKMFITGEGPDIPFLYRNIRADIKNTDILDHVSDEMRIYANIIAYKFNKDIVNNEIVSYIGIETEEQIIKRVSDILFEGTGY